MKSVSWMSFCVRPLTSKSSNCLCHFSSSTFLRDTTRYQIVLYMYTVMYIYIYTRTLGDLIKYLLLSSMHAYISYELCIIMYNVDLCTQIVEYRDRMRCIIYIYLQYIIYTIYIYV